MTVWVVHEVNGTDTTYGVRCIYETMQGARDHVEAAQNRDPDDVLFVEEWLVCTELETEN